MRFLVDECTGPAVARWPARPLPRQTPFDLLKHDVLKYGKSWDDEKAGRTEGEPPPSAAAGDNDDL